MKEIDGKCKRSDDNGIKDKVDVLGLPETNSLNQLVVVGDGEDRVWESLKPTVVWISLHENYSDRH